MTVATETCLALANWTGVETGFTAGFSAKAAADVAVTSIDASGGITSLVLGVHFSITLGAGGAVTVVPIAMPSPPTTIVMARDTPAIQGTGFVDLATYSATVHETLHDKSAMRDAELRRDLARAPKMPFGSTAPAFPLPQANTPIGWNSAGDGLENVDIANLGDVIRATEADVRAGTDDGRFVTPIRVRQSGLEQFRSPVAISFNVEQNNFDFSNGLGAGKINCAVLTSLSAVHALTGLLPGVDGQLLLLRNGGTHAIPLRNQSPNSNAAGRFKFTATTGEVSAATGWAPDVVLGVAQSLLLRYDALLGFWTLALARAITTKLLSDYGASGKGTTVQTTAVNDAIDDANASGGFMNFILPAGQVVCDAALHAITEDGVFFSGEAGPEISRFAFSGSNNGLQWGDTFDPVELGGLLNVGLSGTGTAGKIALNLKRSSRLSFVNLDLDNIAVLAVMGDAVNSSSLLDFQNIRGRVAATADPLFDMQQGAGLFVRGFRLFVIGARPDTSPAPSGRTLFKSTSYGWDTFSATDGYAYGFDRPGSYSAGASVVVQNMDLSDNYLDGCNKGVLVNADVGGTINGIKLSDNWLGNYGNSIEQTGAGNVNGNHYHDNRFVITGRSAFKVAAGHTDFKFNDNHIFEANRDAVAANAIDIAAGCDKFEIVGNSFGGTHLAAVRPAKAIVLGGACSNFLIANNNARGFGTVADYDLAPTAAHTNFLVRGNAGQFDFGSDFITPTLITANRNDWDPVDIGTGASLATASTVFISADAARDITGLAGCAPNRRIIFINTQFSVITFKHESGSSAAGNRFQIGADTAVPRYGSLSLIGNADGTRWNVAAGAAQLNGVSFVASGSPGGLLYFSTSTAVSATAPLTANQLVIGAGATGPVPLGSLGTVTTVYHGNAAGAGSFGAVALAADVSGTLPPGNGGTGVANSKTLTMSGSLTFSGTDGSTVAFGTGGTVIYNGGAGGTPSSITLTNGTGLPIATGVAGLGTSVATALGVAVGTTGAFLRQEASGTIILRNSLGADVNMSVISAWYDGPSVAQGTTGTWLIIGRGNLTDSGGAAGFAVRLTDGTTEIDSASPNVPVVSQAICVTLFGTITNPAGNCKFQAKNFTSTTGKIIANNSGSGKDSSITAIRLLP